MSYVVEIVKKENKMKSTKQERKKEAVEFMKKLELYKPFINAFKKNNKLTYFEFHAGYCAEENEELQNKIEKIESEYDCTVYAVTHERRTNFGELYDFLIIPEDKENWDMLLKEEKAGEGVFHNLFWAYAYTWNKTDENKSEFGTIIIDCYIGGLKRIG